MSKYEELRKINVNEHIEKKNNLSYLSWAWAVDTLLLQDPAASWKYADPVKFGDTLMVFCTVTAFGKEMTAQLPVMDYKNKAIPNPDAFAVNTAMQRCLAKAIALHGLGLYIYAGEDIPDADNSVKSPKNDTPGIGNISSHKTPLAGALDGFNPEEIEAMKEIAAQVVEFATKEQWDDAFATYDNIDENDKRVAVWYLLGANSSVRSKIKSMGEQKRKAA